MDNYESMILLPLDPEKSSARCSTCGGEIRGVPPPPGKTSHSRVELARADKG